MASIPVVKTITYDTDIPTKRLELVNHPIIRYYTGNCKLITKTHIPINNQTVNHYKEEISQIYIPNGLWISDWEKKAEIKGMFNLMEASWNGFKCQASCPLNYNSEHCQHFIIQQCEASHFIGCLSGAVPGVMGPFIAAEKIQVPVGITGNYAHLPTTKDVIMKHVLSPNEVADVISPDEHFYIYSGGFIKTQTESYFKVCQDTVTDSIKEMDDIIKKNPEYYKEPQEHDNVYKDYTSRAGAFAIIPVASL